LGSSAVIGATVRCLFSNVSASSQFTFAPGNCVTFSPAGYCPKVFYSTTAQSANGYWGYITAFANVTAVTPTPAVTIYFA
jgi:hypothetical protein